MSLEQKLLTQLVQEFLGKLAQDRRLNHLTENGQVTVGASANYDFDHRGRYTIGITLKISEVDLSELNTLFKIVKAGESESSE